VAKSEFKCPGVGRCRDTPVRDRDVQFRRMDNSQNNGASAPPAEEQVQLVQEDQEPAGCREEDPDPPANAGHHLGDSRPWAGMVADRPPMPPRHSASAPSLPEDYRACHFPGVVRACSSPGEIATTHLREAMAEPCQCSLRHATGRVSPPHR
jgi:hypothetical protein